MKTFTNTYEPVEEEETLFRVGESVEYREKINNVEMWFRGTVTKVYPNYVEVVYTRLNTSRENLEIIGGLVPELANNHRTYSNITVKDYGFKNVRR